MRYAWVIVGGLVLILAVFGVLSHQRNASLRDDARRVREQFELVKVESEQRLKRIRELEDNQHELTAEIEGLRDANRELARIVEEAGASIESGSGELRDALEIIEKLAEGVECP